MLKTINNIQEMIHFQNFWNIMLATDSYKASHHNMLPEGLTYMESYCESRGGNYPYTLFFGMQYYIKSYLVGIQVTEEKIQEAVQFYNEHFGQDNIFNEKGWRYILENCGGKLPLKIESVKEGTVMPTKNILFKISNTDPNCAWLVNWVETLLMKLWYPITIATNSMAGREFLDFHMEKSGTSNMQDFMLHDFGYRGVATEEQAWIGGAASLLNFKGTDTVAGIRMTQKYYHAGMTGYSVNASEHMVMCMGGKEDEINTYKRIIRKYPNGILSLVSDTYDVYNVCTFCATDKELKELILNRDGKLVFRFDSGDPMETLIKGIEILAEGFGFTVNEKGYKVLNPKVAILQGDGIDIFTMHQILNFVESKGWSIDNFVFGSGGGLLQKFNRDDLQFAIKASYVTVNGVGIDVYKDPITSSGSKKSKKGQIELLWDPKHGYVSFNHKEIAENEYLQTLKRQLETVYLYGDLVYDVTFDNVKEQIHYTKNLTIQE